MYFFNLMVKTIKKRGRRTRTETTRKNFFLQDLRKFEEQQQGVQPP